MSTKENPEEIVGVFMYDWQLELVIEGLAYYASRAYVTEDKLEDLDNLIDQLENGASETFSEDEIVAYYAEEGDDDDDGTRH